MFLYKNLAGFKDIEFLSLIAVASQTFFDKLKLFKNEERASHFILKAIFALDIFTFLYWKMKSQNLKKRFDQKTILNFKIYDVTDWTKNNYNRRIVQYLKI